MCKKLRLRRWLAMVVLAVMAFTQASLVFSACTVERGSLARAIGPQVTGPCDMTVVTVWTKYANRCLAHCTADLQAPSATVPLAPGPAYEPVLVLARLERLPLVGTGLQAPPAGAPPPRILLHAFLV